VIRVLLSGLRSQKNFIGCLHDVFFNQDDLLDLLNVGSEDVDKVKYHGDGPALLGCHDLTVSCIQFTHDAAFARMEHSSYESFELQLSLKTLKSNCILTYTETATDTERGYVQVYFLICSYRQIYLSSFSPKKTREKYRTVNYFNILINKIKRLTVKVCSKSCRLIGAFTAALANT